MSFLDDLTKASNLLNQNATQLAVQQRVNEASSAAQQMRQQMVEGQLKEQEFRKQSSQLAKDLQAQLVSVGADANDVQLAFKAIAPQQYGNPLQAQLAGETEVAARGEAFLETRKQKEHQRQLEFFQAKQQAKGKSRRVLTKGDLDDIDSLDNNIIAAESILTRAKNNTNLTGPADSWWQGVKRWADKDFDSLAQDVNRFNLEFRKRITGTAGSKQELEFIEKNSPSITDPDENLQLKMRNMTNYMKVSKARKLLNRAKAGYDVDGFQNALIDGQQAIEQINKDNGTKFSLEHNGRMTEHLKEKVGSQLKNKTPAPTGARKHFTVY